MWLFLATEVLFFGGMFCCYTVYRSAYPAAFGHASNHLESHPGRAEHGDPDHQQLYHGLRGK